MKKTEFAKLEKEIKENLVDMNLILELLELPQYEDSEILHKRYEKLHNDTKELKDRYKILTNK